MNVNFSQGQQNLVSFMRDRFLKVKENNHPTQDHFGSICFAASSHAALHYIFVVFVQPNNMSVFVFEKRSYFF